MCQLVIDLPCYTRHTLTGLLGCIDRPSQLLCPKPLIVPVDPAGEVSVIPKTQVERVAGCGNGRVRAMQGGRATPSNSLSCGKMLSGWHLEPARPRYHHHRHVSTPPLLSSLSSYLPAKKSPARACMPPASLILETRVSPNWGNVEGN